MSTQLMNAQINIMKICSKYLSSYTNEISSTYIKSTKLNGFDFVKPNCAQKAVAAACMHACIMHGQHFLLLHCNFKDVFELHLGIIDGATSHVMTLCVRLSHEFQVFTIRDHSSITSSKRWVGGVRKWQFLMIYSTVNHQRGGWVGLKMSKT